MKPLRAGWQSGHAAACKAVYAGSIPTPASKLRYERLPIRVFPVVAGVGSRLQVRPLRLVRLTSRATRGHAKSLPVFKRKSRGASEAVVCGDLSYRYVLFSECVVCALEPDVSNVGYGSEAAKCAKRHL